ncbi:polysaccharide deacetylase family sporulation protein PdaB [Paenibacillus validus]|uniref:Polysaccharide deacetylase family sporulation protein PdaB n=1 Tax=Paenibacillus validus TaxID=44253 RepID=A0A7X2ZEQ7_9BACL|nr:MULTISPECIES: polysaccharide deacetylase family sporulation protein PdaB [Paenibacillus]MED4600322.1 polysaccharide deacetylase family sporulation protein PdaB [Paenibacillus validus]MED4605983.1 polysaccharide deacetylase family sporulation protein PdaB [Paenibacillus validus]MUG73473.1 polysaccharide deacetylase family sporulation protein PdaB [Paenibacillus validus]
MNFFYVMNGKKLKQALIICVAVLFAAGIIYSERGNVSVFSQNEPAAVYNVPTEKKLIALTFDISWGDKRTEPILKVLEDKGVKNASFFLSSPWSESHPDIVKRIVKAGWEIGSHGHKHVNYSSLSDEEIRTQIKTAHTILSEVTEKNPNLIRLPNGDFDKRVLRIANELNYTVIQWDTDSLDWKNPGVENIVNRVVTKAHPGDIVLMHASDSCKETHEALPVIIDKLREKGYEFVTVSQLMKQTQVDNKPPVEDQTMKRID